MAASLEPIYGQGAAGQLPRYRAGYRRFADLYGEPATLVCRASGRVNLIGEHTDYNHGFVLPVALDRDTLLFARPRPDGLIHLQNSEPDFPPVAFASAETILPGPPGDWGNYARGVAETLARDLGRALVGFDGLVVGQAPQGVPRGAGLSSSSALTVAVAVALASLNGWEPTPEQLAGFCARAEWYVGTRGGIMDHFASVLGQQGNGLFLDCRPDGGGRYRFQSVPLPAGYQLLIVNSGVSHRNVGGGFNSRVAACRAGVALLNGAFPGITHLRDVQAVPWDDLAPHLPQDVTASELAAQGVDLGDLPGLDADLPLRVRARCRHVWSENRRVEAAVTAMQRGDVATLGGLLNAAHDSARDDYEVSCDELEVLVGAARQVEGVAGARLTGAGWGGCIIALVHHAAAADFTAQVGTTYRATTGIDPAIFACRAASGAGRVAPEAFLPA
ncbi:MAG: galactokinase [Anaerolineae bacterium]|nr:galactokinase [Anaerolineae bacterium]